MWTARTWSVIWASTITRTAGQSAPIFTLAEGVGVEALLEQTVQVPATRFRVPDVCVILAGSEPEQIFTTPPFICIEILSRDDRLSAMQERVKDYLAFGVPYVWILDLQAAAHGDALPKACWKRRNCEPRIRHPDPNGSAVRVNVYATFARRFVRCLSGCGSSPPNSPIPTRGRHLATGRYIVTQYRPPSPVRIHHGDGGAGVSRRRKNAALQPDARVAGAGGVVPDRERGARRRRRFGKRCCWR